MTTKTQMTKEEARAIMARGLEIIAEREAAAARGEVAEVAQPASSRSLVVAQMSSCRATGYAGPRSI